MTVATQDPLTTAQRLLRRASTQGKALRVFCGFESRRRLLIATETKADLLQRLPIRELGVPPGLHPETLAATLRAVWTELEAAWRDGPLPKTPERRHAWRQRLRRTEAP